LRRRHGLGFEQIIERIRSAVGHPTEVLHRTANLVSA
jgi:hypothetical protein